MHHAIVKMYNSSLPPSASLSLSQDFVTDLTSDLQLEAEVLPNDIAQPDSPGDGRPQISDLTPDFFIRQLTTASARVGWEGVLGPSLT